MEQIEEVEVFKSNELAARKICQALDEIDRILAEDRKDQECESSQPVGG